MARYLVKINERYVVVRACDILWAESASNYVVLHTAGGNHVVRRTLRQLESELDPLLFFRANRSAIVNLDHVCEVLLTARGEHVLLLQDGAKTPLTRGLRELQERLQRPRGA